MSQPALLRAASPSDGVAPARRPLEVADLLPHEGFRAAVLGARTSRVAVLLPCHNEVAAIEGVVAAFRAALPEARVIVYDNASTDGTAEAARAAGAEVFFEPLPGKGNVVRRMFAEVEADIYLMADGDGTYAADQARTLLDMVAEGRLDMAVGARAEIGDSSRRS